MLIAKVIAFLASHKEILFLGVPTIFEMIARRKPTDKDWSIINLIKRIIDAIAPNKTIDGGVH